MAILKIEHLVKRFGGLAAVNHCNFEIRENSIAALIGPNGAGKTTMFDLIAGLVMPDSGRILFKGRQIENLLPHERARLGIARTFQSLRVFPQLTVLDNLMLAFPGNRSGLFDIFRPFSTIDRKLKERAFELLHMVDLHEKAHEKASEISYGQQKLLEIVRALATGASLFLFDEPAAGVNRTMLHTIINIIRKLKNNGKTIIIVEHDMGFVMELSEHVIVMDYGKEIADGTPSDIQKTPKVLDAYMGVKHNFKNA